MTEWWRRLALTAAVVLGAAVGAANAQTVVVTDAPKASQVTITLNGRTIGSAVADANGQATMDVGRSPNAGKIDTDVHVYIDACGDARRVVFVERGLEAPPPGDGCNRQEISGWFVFRQSTSMLVDVAPPSATVWLRQGPIPSDWLKKGEESRPSKTTYRENRAPAGLVIFGGGGFLRFGDVTANACGNVDCSAKSFRPGFTVGIGYWLNQYIGVEGAFVKSSPVKASASPGTYTFSSDLNTQIVTVAGKVGAPYGPARFYAKGGVTYERSAFTTDETILATTDQAGNAVPERSITLVSRMEGWGYVVGGGIEMWVNKTAGVFVEGGRLKLNGHAIDTGEASLDSGVFYVQIGLTIHFLK